MQSPLLFILTLSLLLSLPAPSVFAEPIDDLTLAAAEGDLATIKKLLNEGVDVNARDSRGWFPLAIAASSDQFRAINLLVKHRADLNQVTVNGNTALMFAANRGCVKSVLTLIALGADVTLIDAQGRTARDSALLRRHSDVAGFLAIMERPVPPPRPSK